MSNRSEKRFLCSLDCLLQHAKDSEWLDRAAALLRSQICPVPWKGWVNHSTTVGNGERILAEGFKVYVRPHSFVGKACYFFPGQCCESRSKAQDHAELFYYEFSPHSNADGVILEGVWETAFLVSTQNGNWTSTADQFLALVAELLITFHDAEFPKEQKVFLKEETRYAVPWTLFSTALPEVEGLIIDRMPPTKAGTPQHSTAIDVMAVFKDCNPSGLTVARSIPSR